MAAALFRREPGGSATARPVATKAFGDWSGGGALRARGARALPPSHCTFYVYKECNGETKPNLAVLLGNSRILGKRSQRGVSANDANWREGSFCEAADVVVRQATMNIHRR